MTNDTHVVSFSYQNGLDDHNEEVRARGTFAMNFCKMIAMMARNNAERLYQRGLDRSCVLTTMTFFGGSVWWCLTNPNAIVDNLQIEGPGQQTAIGYLWSTLLPSSGVVLHPTSTEYFSRNASTEAIMSRIAVLVFRMFDKDGRVIDFPTINQLYIDNKVYKMQGKTRHKTNKDRMPHVTLTIDDETTVTTVRKAREIITGCSIEYISGACSVMWNRLTNDFKANPQSYVTNNREFEDVFCSNCKMLGCGCDDTECHWTIVARFSRAFTEADLR